MSEKAGGDNPLGLTLETPIVKFLIAVGAVTFSIPILAWGGASLLALALRPLTLPPPAAFRISRMRKAAARSLKAALRAKAEAEGEEWSDSGSDNSSDSEWDVERAIGEKARLCSIRSA
jgi:ABC-type transport system involved in cytochrome bd biosynthesis fused ATPase/permease subunit